MTGEEILKDAKKYGMNFIDDLNSTLEKESDRGIILICASTIDSVLRDLIEKYLNKNKGRKKEISKLFEYPNPLSSFASKIQMSYCLGLISKDIYEDFERVRKIRNNLAHGVHYNCPLGSDEFLQCNNLHKTISTGRTAGLGLACGLSTSSQNICR